MGMRSDVEYDDLGRGAEGAASSACDAHDPPIWTLGSRIATRYVQAARKAYLGYAENAERALNRVDTTTSRLSEDVWAVASGARDALLDLPGMRSKSAPAQGTGAAAWKAKMARVRADLRDIALRGQIATDTNMRAYLDHLDDLAKASSAKTLLSAQSSYVWDQWQRSLQQAFDLQHRTVGALRTLTSASAA